MSDESPFAKVSPVLGMLAASFEGGDTTKYSRSDALRALINPMAATGVALPLLTVAHSPSWLIAGDAIAFGLTLLLYLGVYIYCFIKRPDALRSEKFELTKYAIEQHLYGDSSTGLIEGAVPVRLVSGEKTRVRDASGSSE